MADKKFDVPSAKASVEKQSAHTKLEGDPKQGAATDFARQNLARLEAPGEAHRDKENGAGSSRAILKAATLQAVTARVGGGDADSGFFEKKTR